MANPIGSTDPDDFLTNVGKLDHAINEPSAQHWTDRMGVQRWTWHGFEARFNTFLNDSQASVDTLLTASQQQVNQFMTTSQKTFSDFMTTSQDTFTTFLADSEKEFRELLASLGYEPIGDYDADGPLTIENGNQIFTKDGEYYRPAPGLALPYTTVDDWTIDEANFIPIGDASLRSELALPGGVRLVGNAPIQLADTVELVNAAWLVEGDVVETRGYYGIAPGLGWNQYDIRTASSSTPHDAGSAFDLANGLQAVATFPEGVRASQWGLHDINSAADNTARAQAFFDYVASRMPENGPVNAGLFDYDVFITDTLTIKALGAETPTRVYFDAVLTAEETFPPGEPMVSTEQQNAECLNLRLNGLNIAGSVHRGANGATFLNLRINSCVTGPTTVEGDGSLVESETASSPNRRLFVTDGETHIANRGTYYWSHVGEDRDAVVFEMISNAMLGVFSYDNDGNWRLNSNGRDDGNTVLYLTGSNTGFTMNKYSHWLEILVNDQSAFSFGPPSSTNNEAVIRFSASLTETAQGNLHFSNTGIWRMDSPQTDTIEFYLGSSKTGFFVDVGNSITVRHGGADSWRFLNNNKQLRPTADNTSLLGGASYYIKQAYITTVTSPAALADTVEDITAAELRIGAALKPRRYRIAGDDRWHYGFVLDDVIQAFQAEGIDPVTYGAVHAAEDDDGNPTTELHINQQQVSALVMAARLAAMDAAGGE